LVAIRSFVTNVTTLPFFSKPPSDKPGDACLTEIRERVIGIIDAGTGPERMAMFEALVAELRIDEQTATPVVRVPLSREGTPSILHAETRPHPETVRACPPSVGRAGFEPATEGL
jgi:hypothetical protein